MICVTDLRKEGPFCPSSHPSAPPRRPILNSVKSRLFPIKDLDKISTSKLITEPTPEAATEPTKQKKSKIKL